MVSVPKIVVIIPCLNEAAAVAQVVCNARRHLPAILVVDDGSADQTGELARAAGAEVLRNDITCGKGASVCHGLQWARQHDFSAAILMDGDGQHAPADIPKFIAALTRAELVVGNRMHDCAQMPWLRRWVNRWMSKRLSALSGKTLPDTQCGFRAVQLEAWSKLQFETAHFEFESELLLAFTARAHTVEFVPIEVIYKNERSKIHPVKDTIRWFKWLLRARRKFGTRVNHFSAPTTSPALQSNSTLPHQ